jgi:hypothetical protein
VVSLEVVLESYQLSEDISAYSVDIPTRHYP